MTVLTKSLKILGLQSQIVAHGGRWKTSKRLTQCETSDQNWVRVQRRAYQTKALNESFTTHIHTLSKTRNFGAQIGSQSQNCVQIWGRKTSPSRFVAWALEPRFSPAEGMSIWNGSPNQALQVGHAHSRPFRRFARESRAFNPKLLYTDWVEKMSTRYSVWRIEPTSGRIIAANKDIKRKRVTNHSQLKFTPARVQRDSAPSPHQRPYPSSRSYSCAPSPVKQTHSPSFACGLSRPVCKLGDDFPSGGGGGGRRSKLSAHYLTKLARRSLDFTRRCADLISIAWHLSIAVSSFSCTFSTWVMLRTSSVLVRPRARGPPRAPRQEVAESDVTICISAVRMNAIRSKRLGSAWELLQTTAVSFSLGWVWVLWGMGVGG